jgi:hypothetical protein
MVTGEPENPCLNLKAMPGLGPTSAETDRRGKNDDKRRNRIKPFLIILDIVLPFPFDLIPNYMAKHPGAECGFWLNFYSSLI